MGLHLKNVNKAYGSVVALVDAEMAVSNGEIRALLGGNGSGKSTLAKILAGTVKEDRGEFELNGEPYSINSPIDAKKKKVIATSQELSLLSNLTVAENLCIHDIPVNKGFADKKAMREKAIQVLEKLGILDLLDRTIDTLAASEQYMIEFAKALLADPDVMIVDEITSALYSADVGKVRDALKELKEKGRIVIFISHRMAEIFSICDNVTVMRNGRILDTYDVKNIDQTTLLNQMTGKDILTENIVEEHIEYVHSGEDLLKVIHLPIEGFGSTVDLDIKSGEVIGITGLEGHGQSVLLRTLFGLINPYSLELFGVKTQIHNPRQAVKKRFAFISGDRTRYGVFGERSIVDNVEVVINQVLRQKVKDVIGILKEFNVKYGSAKNRILSLSGGNQQKVVIGRWVASKPVVLLADDPTKGVDVQARKDIHEIFVNLAAEGSAVIMVSSDEDELLSISTMTPYSRVLVMYEGKIVKALTGKNINKENISLASMQIKQGA
jgi:ABC-type sugar transport system ATPase subunit